MLRAAHVLRAVARESRMSAAGQRTASMETGSIVGPRRAKGE